MKVSSVSFYSFSKGDALSHLRFTAAMEHLDIPVIFGVENGKVKPELALESDLVIIQRDLPRDLDGYKELRNLARSKGIPIVYDIDDLLIALPETHPDRLSSYFAPSLLPILQALIEADYVTVSTNRLRQELLQFNQNIYVLPNFLDESIWKMQLPLLKKKGHPLILGYMGNNSHQPDLEWIAPVLLELDDHCKNELNLLFYGTKPPNIMLNMINVSWIPLKTYNYKEFAEEFQTMEVDIFIAPLVDSIFNRCKSAIKFFEYSALGAPGVFSRLEPYTEVIKDGENGLLATSKEEWYAQLVRMIEDPELRYKIAIQAQNKIKNNWTISKNALLWQKTYQTIRKRGSIYKEQKAISFELVQSITQQLNDYHTIVNSNLNSQKEEIDRLSLQMGERVNFINALTVKLEEQKKEINSLLTQHEAQEKELHNYTLKLEKQKRLNDALSTQLKERNKEYDAISFKLEEQISVNKALLTKLKRQDRDYEALKATKIELEKAYSALDVRFVGIQQELNEIKISKAWRVALLLRKVRSKIAPVGGKISNILSKVETAWVSRTNNLHNQAKKRKDRKLIRKSRLFDNEWYLSTNPDVQEAGVDPLSHFLQHGWIEGRNPSSKFDTFYYLTSNPDVKSANVNPLVHYLYYGRKEGRSPLPGPSVEDLSKNYAPKLEKGRKLFTKSNLKKSAGYIKHYGFLHFLKKALQVTFPSRKTQNSIDLSTVINIRQKKEEGGLLLTESEVITNDIKISVVIPTKNAGDEFLFLAKMLKNQKGFKDIELVVVDSGSEDNTLRIADQFGAKVVKIRPEEFSHSFARNLGAEHATGDYLLFTVQDALPTSDTWLYELFSVLKQNDVCAVSCAETPRENADLFYRLISWNHYNFLDVNWKDRIFTLPIKPDYLSLRKNGQLSDLACLISRNLLLKYKYRLDYAEDLDLGIRLIKDGNKIAFLGTTRIIHSHNRSSYYFLKRGYVDNLFLSDMFSDFVIPKLNIDEFIPDVAFAYKFLIELIQSKLSKIALPCKYSVFEILIRDDLNSADRLEFPSKVEMLKMVDTDKHFSAFIEELIDPDGYIYGGKPYNGLLINALKGYVNITLNYINNTYELIDDKLIAEIKECLVKEFAIIVGAYLAYCYKNETAKKYHNLEKIHMTLKADV